MVVAVLVASSGFSAVIFYVTVGVWAVGERVLLIRDRLHGVRVLSAADRGSFLWTAGGVTAGVAAGFVLAGFGVAPLPGAHGLLIAGLVVAWAGLGLRAWAVVSLGRSFTTRVMVRDDQEVVTTGPFHLVRHPSYLGLLLTMAGFGLALADAAGLAAIVVLPAIGLVHRIGIEEDALSVGLGERYAAYCAGRARLLPHLW